MKVNSAVVVPLIEHKGPVRLLTLVQPSTGSNIGLVVQVASSPSESPDLGASLGHTSFSPEGNSIQAGYTPFSSEGNPIPAGCTPSIGASATDPAMYFGAEAMQPMYRTH